MQSYCSKPKLAIQRILSTYVRFLEQSRKRQIGKYLTHTFTYGGHCHFIPTTGRNMLITCEPKYCSKNVSTICWSWIDKNTADNRGTKQKTTKALNIIEFPTFHYGLSAFFVVVVCLPLGCWHFLGRDWPENGFFFVIGQSGEISCSLPSPPG